VIAALREYGQRLKATDNFEKLDAGVNSQIVSVLESGSVSREEAQEVLNTALDTLETISDLPSLDPTLSVRRFLGACGFRSELYSIIAVTSIAIRARRLSRPDTASLEEGNLPGLPS